MHVSLWIIYVVIVMIVPDIVQNKWKSEPSTIDIIQEGHTQLEEELQTTRTQLGETRTDLQTTRTQLEETRTQLQTTRTHLEGELQTLRTQLGDTQTQLETTRTQLGGDLQSAHNQLQNTRTELEITNLKLRNAEARIGTLEQTMTSILSKLNV